MSRSQNDQSELDAAFHRELGAIDGVSGAVVGAGGTVVAGTVVVVVDPAVWENVASRETSWRTLNR